MTGQNHNVATKTAQAFIDAFNLQDHAAIAKTLNYPHIRLAKGKYSIIDSANQFIKLSAKGQAQLKKERWGHTVMSSARVIHSGEDKVHLSLDIQRCHADGSVYNRFDTLWIVTRVEGHWGIQFRSSFLR
jgi:hypothetical protein